MSYYILQSELNDTGKSFDDHVKSSDDLLADLHGKIAILTEDESAFSGTAAESVKSYFNEVHGCLINAIGESIDLLKLDYQTSYLCSYIDEPIKENDQGKLSEQELRAKSKWADRRIKCRGEIEDSLTSVKRALPEDVRLAIPDTYSADDELKKLKKRVDDLASAIEAAENKGFQTFKAQESGFRNYKNNILAMISTCKEFDISSYRAGTISSSPEFAALSKSHNEFASSWDANVDKMISTQETMYGQLHDREVRKFEEERARWDKVGLAVGVLVLIVGVAATVATCGAATSVVGFALAASSGSISTATTMVDIYKRSDKVFGKEDSAAEGASEYLGNAKKISRYAKGTGKVIDSLGNGKYVNAIKDASKMIGHQAVDDSVDRYKNGLNDADASFVADSTNKIGSEVVDQMLDKAVSTGSQPWKVDGASAVKAVLEVGQDYADLQSEKCDQRIEASNQAYENKMDELKDSSARQSFSQRNACTASW